MPLKNGNVNASAHTPVVAVADLEIIIIVVINNISTLKPTRLHPSNSILETLTVTLKVQLYKPTANNFSKLTSCKDKIKFNTCNSLRYYFGL